MSEQERLLLKAERFLQSARLLLEDGDLDSAVSRLYYASFYVAEALLDAKGLSYSSHKAVISAYGQHFAKTGILDPGFHKLLVSTFEKRQMGDYLTVTSFTDDEVEELIGRVATFIQSARSWLTPLNE